MQVLQTLFDKDRRVKQTDSYVMFAVFIGVIYAFQAFYYGYLWRHHLGPQAFLYLSVMASGCYFQQLVLTYKLKEWLKTAK